MSTNRNDHSPGVVPAPSAQGDDRLIPQPPKSYLPVSPPPITPPPPGVLRIGSFLMSTPPEPPTDTARKEPN